MSKFLVKEYNSYQCFPPKELIFNAFNKTPFEEVKCVIIGQDPYHGFGQAMGLSFSVPNEIKIPPSLKNIFTEIKNEFNINIDINSGDLTYLAEQGVLLLNSVLTVRSGSPGSHANHGWETFTDNIIKALNDNKSHVVYMLWGNYAKNKGKIIDKNNNLVLESAHPSPYSVNNFYNNNHFIKCNQYLKYYYGTTIKWLNI